MIASELIKTLSCAPDNPVTIRVRDDYYPLGEIGIAWWSERKEIVLEVDWDATPQPLKLKANGKLGVRSDVENGERVWIAEMVRTDQ